MDYTKKQKRLIKILNYHPYYKKTTNRSIVFLDFLIKKYFNIKKDLKIGQRIHLLSRKGMYTIDDMWEFSMVLKTNTGKHIVVFYSDFKCLAGGIENFPFN